jgi:hypothetical protein
MDMRSWDLSRAAKTAVFSALLMCAAICAAPHPAEAEGPSDAAANADPSVRLDSGFRRLYELDFSGARVEFLAFQRDNPDDPLGKAAEAASYLYEQLNEKGVFTSAFFLNDAKFLNGVGGDPAANHNQPFLDANNQARSMAQALLRAHPRDSRGLLVLTLTDGMESEYLAIIQKKQLAGLNLMRHAEKEASELLAIDPSAQDAYLALGTSNYIIGCLPSYKRAFLWVGGIHGDRAKGIQQLQLTAEGGRYLRPFAKILLALAYEREHQMDEARRLLADLTSEFPANPLYARELALADHLATPAVR